MSCPWNAMKCKISQEKKLQNHTRNKIKNHTKIDWGDAGS